MTTPGNPGSPGSPDFPDTPEIAACAGAELATTTRRGFLFLGLLALAGCAGSPKLGGVPDPLWPDGSARPYPQPVYLPPTSTHSPGAAAGSATMPGVLGRSQWAKGSPVPTLMNRMLPISHITIHHDGMTPFDRTDPASCAARIDLIRNSHRSKGWGDIGYHYIVDRSGRVWEGRPLGWQGAHVKDHNEGNVGVLTLGNFDVQTPSDAQLNALYSHLNALMRTHGVSIRNVHSHQEWASTACPGRNLQRRFKTARDSGAFA